MEDNIWELEYLRQFNMTWKNKEKLTQGAASNKNRGYTEEWTK